MAYYGQGASVVWHHSLPLMYSFNKTEAAVFSCRLCFLRAFPFISLLLHCNQLLLHHVAEQQLSSGDSVSQWWDLLQHQYRICLQVNRIQLFIHIGCLKIAMPVQYELRRLFHLMNIQTHRNSTQKALFLGAYFNS